MSKASKGPQRGITSARARKVKLPGPKSLVQFFRESPLAGLELDFERDKDAGRDIELRAASSRSRPAQE